MTEKITSAIFVDGANIFSKNISLDDFIIFMKFVVKKYQDKSNIIKMVYANTEGSIEFEKINKLGFTIIQERKSITGGQTNIDQLIAGEVNNTLLECQSEKPLIVLFSGDGNNKVSKKPTIYQSVINTIKQGYKLDIWSWQRCLSGNFRTARDISKDLVKIYLIDNFCNEKKATYKFEKLKEPKYVLKPCKYKIKLCRHYYKHKAGLTNIKCLNGNKCTFAHGLSDVREQDVHMLKYYGKSYKELYLLLINHKNKS